MKGQIQFQLPDPPPSRICMDLAEWTGNGTGVFGWSGKASRSSRIEWGGITFWPSPRSDRADLERLGAPWGLSFHIDGDPAPEVPLYPVPGLEVFAWDEGGWLGPWLRTAATLWSISGGTAPFSGRRRMSMPLSSCCGMGPTGRPDWSRNPAFKSTSPGRTPPGSGSSCGGKRRPNSCIRPQKTGRPFRGGPFASNMVSGPAAQPTSMKRTTPW